MSDAPTPPASEDLPTDPSPTDTPEPPASESSGPVSTRRFWSRVIIEGGVIVFSILLAFGIDAGWEARKKAERRAELIVAMRADFETTQQRLAASQARGDSLLTRSGAFLNALREETTLPLDSMGYLLGGAMRGIFFEPTLSSYDAAVSTGDIGLIQAPGLLEALAEFRQRQNVFEEHTRIFNDIYYTGAGWELRRAVGSQWVLEGALEIASPSFRMSEREYREWLRGPEVYAGVQSAVIAHLVMTNALRRMDRAIGKALEELDALP